MTDEEIVRACATKVMGWWHEPLYNEWVTSTESDEPNSIYYHADFDDWNPLTDLCASDALLERMATLGPLMIDHDAEGWKVTFICDRTESYHADVIGEDRKRTIAIAALKAIGGYQE